MRAVVQRVTEASVEVDDERIARIGPGLLVLVGVANDDGAGDATYLAAKIRDLRVFDDEQGRMNRSVVEVGGEVLLVSQFTLLGDARKGRRPSFDGAASATVADSLFGEVVRQLREAQVPVQTGRFQARMRVALVNDGPVTILLDSRRVF